MRQAWLWTVLYAGCVLLPPCLVRAQDGAEGASPAPRDAAASDDPIRQDRAIEQLVLEARESVVVISYSGRDGRREGLGSGFVIDPAGLIATNFHVIGEARPISVQLADGRRFEATAVHAADRALDLAIIRIDAKDLPALELGDSDQLKQGQQVVAIGNPQGLEHSVVSGIVSGTREIDGRQLIQLAIPIEQGNSGGPLLDLQGRVHGLLTLKSAVTANLGFAVAANALKPLLEKPNPVPMERWLTIGALNPAEWTTLFGARWRQRAGRISVNGAGAGFGGRSLCLSTQEPPARPYEIAVAVKMNEEDGAAGLVFCSDGNERHYGFYPSGDELRLTRFDGPDVFSWQVLAQVRSPHFLKGEWNELKVRVGEETIECYCNGKLVVETRDRVLSSGRAGLAKFRHTTAEFKRFEMALEIPSRTPSPEMAEQVVALVAGIDPSRPPVDELINQVAEQDPAAAAVLTTQARRLEQQAERLRQLAAAVHHRRVTDELVRLLGQDKEQVDLLHAALLIAKLDNEELEIEPYLTQVERMAGELKESLEKDADAQAKLERLNAYLFEELGFHGSRTDYYSQSNSYLNEVIDDREGIPITLSVLYIELARRIGVDVEGVGLPGHFVVRSAGDEAGTLIDVFEQGATLSPAEAKEQYRLGRQDAWRDEFLAAQSKQAIVERMLANLIGIARDDQDAERMLRYTDVLLALDPERGPERLQRAALRMHTGRLDEALADTDWLLDHEPEGLDLDQVRVLRRMLEEQQAASAGE